MTRRLVITLTILATILFAVTHAGTETANAGRYKCSHGLRPCWLPPLYWAIAECETGMNWRHNTTGYEGAFGFSKLAWRQYRYRWMPAHAWQATPWHQYRVIRRIGLGGNGCWLHGGYRVWLARA